MPAADMTLSHLHVLAEPEPLPEPTPEPSPPPSPEPVPAAEPALDPALPTVQLQPHASPMSEVPLGASMLQAVTVLD